MVAHFSVLPGILLQRCRSVKIGDRKEHITRVCYLLKMSKMLRMRS